MNYVNGLVSVVIPTYKRSDTLTRAIDSVLEQTYRNVECIVVNDNNPGDEYSQILYKMLDAYKSEERFRFIEQKVHKNGAAARNVGINAAKGEYIAFLDDDDFWDSTKVEVQVTALEALPEEWGAVSCLIRLYKKGKVYAANRPYKDGNVHFNVLIRRIGLGMGSLIIRRRALDLTGYFDENLRRFQDPQLFSYLTEKYKVKLVKRYLHNRDVDDVQNHPTIENIDLLHEAYFKSVAPQLERLPKRKVKVFKTIFQFDKAPVYWHGGQRVKAIKFVAGIFKYPETVGLAMMRFIGRLRKRIFVNSRLKKYE